MSRYDIDLESGERITVPGYRIGEINGQPVWIPADGSTTEGEILQDGKYDPESVVSMPTEEVIRETEEMIREEAAKRGQLEDEYDVSAIKPYGELQAGDSFYGADGAIYTVHPQRGAHGELMVLRGVDGVEQGMQPMTEEEYIRMTAPREEAAPKPQAASEEQASEEQGYAPGDVVSVRDENGNETEGRIVSLPDADGKYQVETETAVNGKRVHEFTREELDGMQPVGEQERKEKYTLSEKKSGNGEPFYQDENGNIDLVQLPQDVFDEIGYTNAPFRLSPSMIAHMLEQHGQELGISSTDEAISFVLDVMNNFDHVRLGYDGALIFSIENGRKRVGKRAVTILINSDNGEFYGLKTSGYESVNGLSKRPMLWERGAKDVSSSTDAASASVPTGKSPLSGEQSGSASHQNTGLDEDKGSLSDGEKQGTEEENVSAMQRIPLNDKGEPDFEAAPVADTVSALMELNDNNTEEAKDTAKQLVDVYRKKLKEAEKASTKGSNVMQITALKKAKAEKIKAINEKMAYWNEVVEQLTPKKAGLLAESEALSEANQQRLSGMSQEEQQEAQARVQRKIDSGAYEQKKPRSVRYGEEDVKMGEANSVMEHVLREIATGRVAFKWGDKGQTKGLGAHLGFSNSEAERKKLIWALSSDGMTPEAASERIYENMPEQLQAMTDQQSVFNMVLDAFQQYGSPSKMWEEAKRLHGSSFEENLPGYDEYVEKQRLEWEAEQNRMSVEEWVAYCDYIRDEIERQYGSLTDEEINAIFEEFYEQSRLEYEARRHEESAGSTERQGDHQQSDGVLHEQGADNTGAAESSEGGQPGSEATADGESHGVVSEQDGISGQASLLDVVRILYSKGKEAASKLFQRSFFDVATTPKFMKELGLRGDKFTIKYGVIARHIGKDGSHNLTEKDWEQLPQALQNPFAISKLTDKENSYRIYTTLQTASGEFAVVGVDVKNADREIEVNAVSTVFGRRNNANLPKNEEVVYRSNEITPEQSSLLERPNFAQYPTEQELSEDKGSETSPNNKGLSEKIAAAEAETDTHPTEKQKEAGNYKKGHVQVGTFDITIEQPKGSVRSGVDAGGNKWETTMQNTYGYIRGTEGVDGDHIDVFLGDDIDGWNGRQVFVVDQYNEDGTFDEHKVMLGFNEQEDAEAAYFANYDKDWAKKHKTVVTAVNLEDFEKWVNSSHRKTKAFAEYKVAKNAPASTVSSEEGFDFDSIEELADAPNTVRRGIKTYATLAYYNAVVKIPAGQFGREEIERMSYDKFEEEFKKAAPHVFKNAQKYLPSVYQYLKQRVETLSEEHVRSVNKAAEAKPAPGEQQSGKKREHKAKGKNAVSGAVAALRDALVEKLREIGIEVVTDSEAAQRVLDEANGKGEQVRTQSMINGLSRASNFILSVLKGRTKQRKAKIEIPERANRLAEEAVKHPIKSHSINANEIVHIRNRHGEKGTANNSNSIPLRDEDISLMPYIMAAPTRVIKGSTAVDGTESVKYEKELENGYVVVVEREGRFDVEDMENITMWAEKKSATNVTVATRASHSTSETIVISEADVAKIKKDAEEAIKNDVKVKEHRVFHGSGAEFDAFDHSHMGEGEGAQAYGWGTYVTEVEGIGRAYANTAVANDRAKQSRHANALRVIQKFPTFESFKNDPKVMETMQSKGLTEADAKAYYDGKVKDARPMHVLYTVEIPDDNGSNYLHWEKPLTDENVERWIKALLSTFKKKDREDEKKWADGLIEERKKEGEPLTGEEAYFHIDGSFSSKKAAKALYKAGFVGISYPAQHRSGGRADSARNFVIFNEKDAKIVDHVRFFRTANGEAYGFTVNGKIYLDPRIATAETPIHEYAHLWADALRRINPKEWANVVELMKGTSVWEEVKRMYPELKTDDAIADEVLAHYSGRRGAERLRAEQEAIASSDRSLTDKATAISALERVKESLKKFWQGVADWLGIHFTTAEEVADKVLADLLAGVNPNQFTQQHGKVREQLIGQKGAAALDKAEEATTRIDNLNVAREMEQANKDAKAIKLATGWERGADGKWRYEVQDFDVDVRGTARRNHLHDKLPWGKEYDALVDKLFNGETLTAEEDTRFEELSSLSQDLQETYEKAETRYLDDYLKDSSLFEAYPELKQVRVEMYNDPRSFVGATWYRSENLIRINEDKLNTQELRSILLHEVQHAIQDIEGFARGGNESTYTNYLASLEEKRDAWAVIEEFEDKRKELGDDARPIDVYNALVEEYRSLGIEFGDGFAPSHEAFDKGFNLWVRGYDNEGYEDAYNEYHRLANKFGLGGGNNRYNQLSGEVEARNVQKRMGMTEEERRNSLAAETEDVAREDQIFLMENAGKADSLGDSFKTFKGEEAIEQLNAFFDIKPSDLPALPAPINSLDAFKEVFAAPVRTVLGTLIKVKEGVFNKLARKEREKIAGGVLPTLQDADFVIQDTDGSKLYVKRYKNAENEHVYNVTVVNKRDEVEDYISSAHIKSNNNLRNKIEKGAELLIPSKRTRYGEQAPSNSTPAANVQQTSENASVAEENYREGEGAYTDEELSYVNDPIAQVMGKPRGTARQRRAFAERERQRMAARVTSLAEKLHLDNVEVVTDASTLAGRQQRAKGFYNKQTGKITVVIPNHASAHDVEQTLLHEAVAHYGLRKLFGEHFDTFLDNVFNHADEQVRKRIAEKRRELYRQYVDNATKGASSLAEKAEIIANLPKQERDFTRTATEEYLASLAEETDFENVNASWWQRIKGFFIDMLHRIGFEDFGGVTLTDNELRYLLWRSYENLAEPGKRRSLAGETKDAMKQYELGVGEYAGSSAPTDGLVAEAGELEEVNARFNAELEQQIDGILPKGHIYRLGMPGDVLQSAGLPDLPIELASIRLSDKSMQENHPFDLQEVKNLPEAIQRPLAVFRSATHIGSFVVMTEIEHNGKNFVVAIQTNKKKGRIEINDIRSVHYRTSNAHMANWISEGLLEYADKKRMAEWFSKQRYNSAEVRKLLNHAAKIVEEFENPTISGEKYEEDELYRDGDPVMYERRLARDLYEERLQKGMYQAQEAMQDSMLSVKEAMQAILGKKTNIEDVAGFENAYIGENRLSSVNQAEAEAFARTVFQPLLDEVAKLAKNDAQRVELTDYMMAKHGLERNRVMAERKAATEARKEFAKELSQAQKAVDKDPLDFLAANQLDDVKQRMAARVTSLAEKLHLDNVEVVTDASTLADRQQLAKGFYNKQTGKITVVIPNHASAHDVEQTLLHEAVAHYGLRKLFGEHFDTFLDNVFNHADEQVRKRIIEKRRELYGKYVENATKGASSLAEKAEIIANLPKQERDFTRTATEEYLASLAEESHFSRVFGGIFISCS